MSDNVFSGAKKSTPQTRVSEIQGKGALAAPVVTHSARVPVSLSKAIKLLAIEEQTSVQALTIEALETLLKLRGKIES